MEKFKAIWFALEGRLLPSYVWTSDPLTFWRERIFFFICFIAVVLGPIVLVPSLLLSYKEGLRIVILVDLLAYTAVVIIPIARNLSFVVRVLVIFSILYAIGFCIFFILGPFGSWYIWPFCASVLISTFIGLSAAIWTLVFNAIVLLLGGIFIAYGNTAWLLHIGNALEKWLVMSINFLLLNAGASIATAFMLNSLKTALFMEQKTGKNLQESEEKYRTILEDIQEGYFEDDLAGNFTFFNDTLCRIMGYPREELMGLNNRQYMDKKELKKVFQVYNKVYTTGEPNKGFDWRIRRKDGVKRYIEGSVSLLKDSSGKPIGFRGIAHDVTEHKQTEKILRENETRLRGITQNLPGIIFQFYAKDNGEYGVNYVSETVAEFSKIATKVDTENIDTIFPLFLSLIHEKDRDRFLTSIKTAAERGTAWNFEGQMIIPPGKIIWFQGLSTPTRYEDLVVFDGILLDITARKKAEEKLQQTLESLKKAVGTTIQVLVSALEARDPYTAGHQSRSANLACAIATEMGLSQDKIDGIRMAGIIHDIGKLSIPAEILSKPTELIDIEFSLIKEHSLTGYEMLKNVESPWPLAEIIYQHHERVDGSGYPRNLKGDEILMESRILAVADVIEAMASHRPYRPSFGIEAALKEISENKGILYDHAVVDACLRLFREKGYQLT